jgi:hypothetical protein
LDEISIDNGEILNSNGARVEFHIEYQGSAGVPNIVSNTNDPAFSQIKFFEPDNIWGRDKISNCSPPISGI